jgi:hypothetical protein
VYLFALTRALLMPSYHRATLTATGLVFGGKVIGAADWILEAGSCLPSVHG